MSNHTYLDNANPAYVESLYDQYKTDPNSVDEGWRRFFEGYEFSKLPSDLSTEPVSSKEVSVFKLIKAYRTSGHLISDTNPVRERRKHKADLQLDYFGLSEADLDTPFEAGNELRIGKAPLRQILDHLQKTYCRSIGAEFMYCRDEKLRQWLYQEMEPIANAPQFTPELKKHILFKINQAVIFENFLHTKYVGKKRFSLEGVEALIPALDEAIRQSANMGAKEFIVGMAHRGRLNVLANIFGKTYGDIFTEFERGAKPDDIKGDGDVKYHLGRSADITTKDGKDVHLTLVANPSHLESVNPVVQGIAYAKQHELYNNDTSTVIPILIHGDAAISGQGVNYELANLSKMNGYSVGGTVHIITNNQLGFTTSFYEGRSSVYCTDLAKVVESPVFHVNADDPEAVVHAVQMAIRIRMAFKIDVFVDILGYRRYGHNEGDEPRFTQPVLYNQIDKHQNVQQIFRKALIEEGSLTEAEANAGEQAVKVDLQVQFEAVKSDHKKRKADLLKGHWTEFRQSIEEDFEASIKTPVKRAILDKIAKTLIDAPKDINVISKIQRVLGARKKLYLEDNKVDWAMAEQLAYGSLLLEGNGVRLSGQDCQRGTFSHRHAVLKDEHSEEKYIPINNLESHQSRQLQVYNSILSEYAILGFEFGYTLARPKTLVIWEAQFGDFSNGAQIITDQYLTSSESKWQRLSGLTLFLPHGYEGQGPEHSSARPERYLQQCAENNMYVANLTTPSNLFHILRRQIKNEFRIPLVIMTPKSLLRHPLVVSPIDDLEKGHFQELIDDANTTPKTIQRVLLCTGKVYYDLLQEKTEKKHNNVAIVRLEQLYPLPKKQLAALKKRYENASEWVWVQEEPANMGAWSHILRHLPEFQFKSVTRKEGASPATGNEKDHLEGQKNLVQLAFAATSVKKVAVKK
ncbi:MAG: 2-oxoglutarate dehydrogenase E1 component [Candidatus Margulisbacteria bacterium]|nr:2-oxoglutarate dehydrogenase E1 component [Candidatus Margulisiibacteriota bacterium]